MSDEEKQTSNDSETQDTAAASPESKDSAASSKDAGAGKESALKAVTATLTTLKELQSGNPKIFYGAIGAIVLLFIIMSIGGSGSDMNQNIKQTAQGLQVGQQYTLRSPNSYDKNSTVRLVNTPGSLAAYDDTEKDDREGGCKHLPQGTEVIIKDFYAAYGNPKAFAKVSPVSGDCKESVAWTSTNNIK